MEYTMTADFLRFLADALDAHCKADPELSEEADHFLDLLTDCMTVGTTLHIS